jgi:hypothetical protein
MPCMCGATDCRSCGPAQGYEVIRVKTATGWRWVNPEDWTEEFAEQYEVKEEDEGT